MKITVAIALLLVLVEGFLLIRTRHQNQMLREAASQIEQVRSELTRLVEAGRAKEAEVQVLNEDLARLRNELESAKAALNSATMAQAKQPPPLERHEETLPLGLTTKDVDIAGMLVRGTNTVGTLFVPLVGKGLERVREIRNNNQPLVFGWLISDGRPAVWGHRDGGTNVGVALHFGSAAEAETVAEKIRSLSTE